ncbi:PE-PGRS family protein [Streptomyces cellulosae]
MQTWAALNERQLTVLKRIGAGSEPVTSKDSNLATTVYALRGRGLVTTPRQNGVWRAEITEAGTYYLEHGRHPDLPDRERTASRLPSAKSPTPAQDKRRETDSVPADAKAESASRAGAPARLARKTRITITAEELIAQIRAAGGTLRVEDPKDDLRAAYRRAIDAAKRQKAVPAGHHLRYTGRTNGSGDLVVQLADDNNPDETSWNRERLKRSRTLTDVDAILSAVQQDPVALEVSTTALPRALDLIRALAEEALSRGHGFSVNKKRRHPRPRVQVDGETWELTFKEEQEQKPHVPTAEELRQRKVYSWQRVTPKYDSVPSGRLTLEARASSYGTPIQWSDTKRGRTLEKQVRTVFKDLEAQAEASRQAHRAWVEEQKKREEQRKREEAEQRARWEKAMNAARVKAREAHRERTLQDGLERWHAAEDIRAFCAALEESAAADSDPVRIERLAQWVRWGRVRAEAIDPTRGPAGFGAEEFDIDPDPEALRPFLGKWSPYRPEEEFRYSPPPSQSQPVTETPRDEGWRYGRQGRAQWWRR